MMRPDVNYYAILGVASTATPEEIVKAYRKKILQVHLDKQGPEDDSDLCYKTIEAYRVLSNRKLRTKYDIQRDPSYKAEEKFIPAGYICYDVQNQMSKRFLKNISDWKEEFNTMNVESGISDNFFESFSSIMGKVLEVEDKETAKALKDKEEEYFCSVCDKKFSSETLHWEEVLRPYITMFSGDNVNNTGGIASLLAYFERLIGPAAFKWEPRSLPSTLLGTWGSSEWGKLGNCDIVVARMLSILPPEDDFSDVEEYIDYIGETFLSDSEVNPILYPELASKCLIFVLENQDDQIKIEERVQECLIRDDLREIFYIVSAMKNYLGCETEEWCTLAKDALASENAEMAILWTKFAVELNEEEDNDEVEGIWYKLGLSLHPLDPVLAHFCFILQGYGDEPETAFEEWLELGDDFCQKGEHKAAVEYYLHANLNSTKSTNTRGEEEEEDDEEDELGRLLEKSREMLKKGDRNAASFYRSTYNALKAKSLLSKLQRASVEDTDSELEELIELIDELDASNPVEGYRIVTATWPQTFETPACEGIHRGTISFFRRGKMTTTAFNLILGALHFLPEEDDEEEFEELQRELSNAGNAMVLRQLRRGMTSSDFSCLTDILAFMSHAAECRSILGALQFLQELEQDLVDKSPHLKAMKYLLEGTIAKIQKDWMTAMNLYQSALLCSPECMHRVLPCISKLSQDIEFHEAILSQVHDEVQGLKECFDSREYPDVDNFTEKRNRNSLVIGDVVPRVDFGYKNSISKIQPDPDKIANQPPPEEQETEPPPIETNTPLVTLDKTEEAIGTGESQGQLSAALSYIDLLKALPLPFQPGPIVQAASHFLRAMDETNDPGSLFAYRNAILQMAENLLKIDRKTQATIQHGLTHKHMLSVLLSAHEKLSRAVRRKSQGSTEEEKKEKAENGDDESEDEESDKGEKDNEKAKKDANDEIPEYTINLNSNEGADLIKTSDLHLISKFLKNVVDFPKIEPLANIPTLNCSDLVYVETLGNSFLSQFCNEKSEQKYQSAKIPKHLHAYTHFVEVWKGRSQLTDFNSAKLKAMQELLALKHWVVEDVEQLMKFSILNLTDDGWSSEYRTELVFPNPPKSFKSINGFKIEYKTGRIQLLLAKDKHTATSSGNLFDVRDIQEIFSNGIEDCSLSLDSPDLNLRSHPFKEAKFSSNSPECKSYTAPNLYMTLARTSMLLCYFCSGLEICARSPFYMKPTDEGLLARLEEHLQHILRPAKTRKQEEKVKQPDLDIPNRFWLNLTEVFEEEEEDSQHTLTYRVGDVKAQVKMNTLILTLNGTKASLTPEAEFARDFTKHYDEIGQVFPEFLRLKELLKICVICKKLKAILRQNCQILKQNGRRKEELMRIAGVCKAIRDLGIYLEEDNEKTRNVSVNFTDCTWLPASYCNIFEEEVYEISAGVRITPELTYFPVSVPSDCIALNARELFAKKKLSFRR